MRLGSESISLIIHHPTQISILLSFSPIEATGISAYLGTVVMISILTLPSSGPSLPRFVTFSEFLFCTFSFQWLCVIPSVQVAFLHPYSLNCKPRF